MTYAATTSVPVSKSKADIERILSQYGADQFITGWSQDVGYVGFRIAHRQVKIKLQLPKAETYNNQRNHEQAVRARWRALFLVIKAKLVAVESSISTIEREFLADIVLPDGSMIGDWIQPQLEEAYRGGAMPALLPA